MRRGSTDQLYAEFREAMKEHDERKRFRRALEEIVATEYCADQEQHAYGIARRALEGGAMPKRTADEHG